MSTDGLDLVHLDRLGNTDADFCLSFAAPRAATLYSCHCDQPGGVMIPMEGTYAHIETVHVS